MPTIISNHDQPDERHAPRDADTQKATGPQLLNQLPPNDGVRRDYEDWSHQVIPNSRGVRFEEMEYMLPRANFPACFAAVRKRIKDKHRQYVGWRVLCRPVAADDAMISPFSGRETMTVALLQNNTLPYHPYHADMEPILREHGGRPHWGKHHSLRAHELAPLYPQWEHWNAIRRELDPHGLLLGPRQRELLETQR